jgi:hypothetical protein
MITVYVTIGNTDDKLPQVYWAAFAGSVLGAVRRTAQHIHGEWVSLPLSSRQNACFCADIDENQAAPLRAELANLAGMYQQDSIAWATATAEFIHPT